MLSKIDHLLMEGAEDKGVWTSSFSEIKSDFAVAEFLADWRQGDVYELLDVNCFENHRPRVVFDADFTTPRLGNARIGAEVKDGSVVAFSLFLSGSDNIFE